MERQVMMRMGVDLGGTKIELEVLKFDFSKGSSLRICYHLYSTIPHLGFSPFFQLVFQEEVNTIQNLTLNQITRVKAFKRAVKIF